MIKRVCMMSYIWKFMLHYCAFWFHLINTYVIKGAKHMYNYTKQNSTRPNMMSFSPLYPHED